jgi:prevent-host-death family protein
MAKPRARRRTIGDAKAHFAECIRDAEAGRSIVLTRHGRAVARLEPIRDPRLREAEGDLQEDVAEPATPYAAAPRSAFRSPAARQAALRRHLVEHIWPRIPKELLGRGITKAEREEILGYASSTGVSSEAGGRDPRPRRTRDRG